MELKQFVKEVIADVAMAVKESQENLLDSGIKVSPDLIKGLTGETYNTKQKLSYIDFDVAISDSEKAESEIGGKGKLVVLSVNGKYNGETLASTTSRIKFSIPIVFPQRSPESIRKSINRNEE